ncbi:DUF2161 domain-containing phosphodiesterase [Planktotalea arctica]|uniref:DUF2161 domain-containing phosphodiesterase n=2 Tax=Planktotalea arctica TaxID=1481893 RepID=UPI00321C3289
MRESDLYAPVKSFLEAQGYEVKGEVGKLDVMAMRGDEPPVIIELKTGFTLSLFHQGVERLSICDRVYICVPRPKGKAGLKSIKNNKALCRRLGLGLLTVRTCDNFVEAHTDPAPYVPRKSTKKTARHLREFQRLVGDPNTGGMTRQGLVTAYRQDALKCLGFLEGHGPTKASDIAKSTGVPGARNLMAANHYGWFERVSKGIYWLSPKGQDALAEYEAELDAIRELYPPPT